MPEFAEAAVQDAAPLTTVAVLQIVWVQLLPDDASTGVQDATPVGAVVIVLQVVAT